MQLFKEFKEFAVRGNVIDLAVGVIIGAAFGKIVDSIVNDIVMPPLGYLMGKVDFRNQYVELANAGVPKGASLDEARRQAGAVVIAWGNLVSVLIQFVILAFVIFLIVKAITKVRRNLEPAPAPAAPPGPTPTEALLTEIRDLMKQTRE